MILIKEIKLGKPEIHPDCFVAENAQIIGMVTAGKYTSFWYSSVTRGDMEEVVIGDYCNVQDGAMLHVDSRHPLILGNHVTVGHGAILHGCTLEDKVLVGMGAIVLNGAVVGEGSIIGAGALVKEGMVVPPRSLVVGVPGKVVRTLDEESLKDRVAHAEKYVALWRENY
jgi:carbonic anhydrase/acetyltransferase-like protein (isoleucine patch superfamily)